MNKESDEMVKDMKETENNKPEVSNEEITDQEVNAQAEGEENVVEEEVVELSEIEKVRLESKVMNDKYLRLMADFENYKRNAIKEKMETIKLANKDIMLSLVSVLDDFDRGMKTIGEASDVASVKEGVDLIYKKMQTTLEQKGLTSMDSLGKAFDADFHEAVCNIPAPKEEDKGKVLDVIEKGYQLKDSIIRFAKVVVGE